MLRYTGHMDGNHALTVLGRKNFMDVPKHSFSDNRPRHCGGVKWPILLRELSRVTFYCSCP